jgi:hypothetical protein
MNKGEGVYYKAFNRERNEGSTKANASTNTKTK